MRLDLKSKCDRSETEMRNPRSRWGCLRAPTLTAVRRRWPQGGQDSEGDPATNQSGPHSLSGTPWLRAEGVHATRCVFRYRVSGVAETTSLGPLRLANSSSKVICRFNQNRSVAPKNLKKRSATSARQFSCQRRSRRPSQQARPSQQRRAHRLRLIGKLGGCQLGICPRAAAML